MPKHVHLVGLKEVPPTCNAELDCLAELERVTFGDLGFSQERIASPTEKPAEQVARRPVVAAGHSACWAMCGGYASRDLARGWWRR